MEQLLAYLPDEETRQILSWAGGGLVVAVTGVWAVFKHRSDAKKKSEPATPPVTQSVTADDGSVAIGRDVVNSPISINHKT